MSPGEVASKLAERVEALAVELLPAGHREGHEWRAGSVAGEPGDSLGVHLTGAKAGVWSDFGAEHKGDALSLVRAVLGLSMGEALAWSCRWLGVDPDQAAEPKAVTAVTPPRRESRDHWRRPWQAARPIAGTSAEVYLRNRGLSFDDPDGRALRFAERHARRNPADKLERHPALLALLFEVRTGEPCGTINIYLRPDGADRIRDAKGKTSWGRAAGAA